MCPIMVESILLGALVCIPFVVAKLLHECTTVKNEPVYMTGSLFWCRGSSMTM